MASPKLIAAGVVLVIAAVVGSMSVFTVRQDQQALVLQFGNPVHAVSEPGLHFKLPIQNVEYYERRILELDPPVQQVLLSDQKRVNVDSFARWKIIDPLIFRQRATNSANFVQLFGQRLNSVIRGELAQAPLVTLLSDNRAQIMEKIQATLIKPAEEFGVELIDVRIGRTDLPQETSQAVYNRMRSSRIAEAAQLRAEGEELKAKIQAEADRERIGIIAEANRQAEVLRGEGDG
ncbi:protease modulator HflC, partial [Thalassospira sp. UBA6510]